MLIKGVPPPQQQQLPVWARGGVHPPRAAVPLAMAGHMAGNGRHSCAAVGSEAQGGVYPPPHAAAVRFWGPGGVHPLAAAVVFGGVYPPQPRPLDMAGSGQKKHLGVISFIPELD